VGLPHSGRRRLTGLRREEVAHVAGISLEYYNRIERGNLAGVSETVLAALATALRLSPSEVSYLTALAHTEAGCPARAASSPPRRQMLQILDAITSPAWIMNQAFDVLAANPMAKAVHQEMFASARRPPNPIRFVFLDPDADQVALDPAKHKARLAAFVHGASARHATDPAFTALVQDLLANSPAFRSYWDQFDVTTNPSGTMFLRHQLVGPLALDFEILPFPTDPGLVLNVQTAPPDSPTWAALERLRAMLDGT
jgi:transcriptional regulator with XRE-family HTH domain